MDASKFTTRSQQAINTAIDAANASGHAQVEAIHLLAALLGQPDGIARPLLEAAGVQPSTVAAGVEAELKKLPAAAGATVGRRHRPRYGAGRGGWGGPRRPRPVAWTRRQARHPASAPTWTARGPSAAGRSRAAPR